MIVFLLYVFAPVVGVGHGGDGFLFIYDRYHYLALPNLELAFVEQVGFELSILPAFDCLLLE